MAIQDEKLSVASLTGGERQGAGAFDELMRAVKSHLATEHDAGRITGDNYANAYISAIDMALGNASQYLLSHEIANQQVRLLDEQIAGAKLQVVLNQSQIDLQAQQLVHLTKQTLKLTSDISLVDSQVTVQSKQALVLTESINNAQKDLLVKDASISYQAAQETMVGQQTANELTRNTQIASQTTKITAETSILNQRAVSEEAQTKDTVAGVAVGGILGKQMSLYQNQSDGYIRDAEQKAAKIMNDTFITTMSTDAGPFDRTFAGVDDTEMKKVMDILKVGVGATV